MKKLVIIMIVLACTATAFGQALYDQPSYVEMARALDLNKKGDLEGAVAAFTKSIQLDPTNRTSYQERSRLLIKLSRFDDAIADLTHLIDSVDKEMAEFGLGCNGFHFMLRAVARTGKVKPGAPPAEYEAAINDYASAIKCTPTSAGYYKARGALYRKQSKAALADADLQKAAELEKLKQ